MRNVLSVLGLACLLTTAVASPASAQASNITIGLPNWPAVLMVPDANWWTGADGVQDQWCQADRTVWNSSWAGNENQIAFTCFAVPDPQTGAWNATTRWRGFSGHTTGSYFAGYDMGVEGQRTAAGGETVDRWYLYRFDDNQTIMHIGKPYPNTLVLGENTKPIDLYATGMIDAPNGMLRAKGMMLAPEPKQGCSSSNAGRISYQAGGPSVKDSVAICAKDSRNVWAWRTIY